VGCQAPNPGVHDVIRAGHTCYRVVTRLLLFYWHFADLDTFHVQVIEHWRRSATEAVIADLELQQSREVRLHTLLRRAFGHHTQLEIRMRAWADNNAEAARAVRDMDRRRREYIERLLVEVGLSEPVAAARAQLLYWAYLGAALSRSTLSGRQLDQMVAELELVGLDKVVRAPALSDGGRGRHRRAPADSSGSGSTDKGRS
jgi:hypothetical protein